MRHACSDLSGGRSAMSVPTALATAKDDIVVYLVDRESAEGASTVLRSTFTEDGTLTEPWPFGFFSPTFSGTTSK